MNKYLDRARRLLVNKLGGVDAADAEHFACKYLTTNPSGCDVAVIQSGEHVIGREFQVRSDGNVNIAVAPWVIGATIANCKFIDPNFDDTWMDKFINTPPKVLPL